jgi:hypothetical protein
MKTVDTLFSAGGMTRKPVNWTSTKVPLWETDCLQFWRAGQPFGLRDVTTSEHWQFVERFAKAHSLEVHREGQTVIFIPRND